jgi:type IV secretory pathway VirB2 component (pilin)
VNPTNMSPEANAFGSAVTWLQGVLLGSVATAVAVIAVASVGLLLFTGRIDVRRAVQVILGCFILFGASSIARGMIEALQGTGTGAAEAIQRLPPPPTFATTMPPPAPTPISPFDPYAGAATPVRR